MTIALTLAVTGVFALELWLGGVDSIRVLMRMGALHSGRLVAEGETWRLITAMFLHGGWLHFTLNTLALVQLAARVAGCGPRYPGGGGGPGDRGEGEDPAGNAGTAGADRRGAWVVGFVADEWAPARYKVRNWAL